MFVEYHLTSAIDTAEFEYSVPGPTMKKKPILRDSPKPRRMIAGPLPITEPTKKTDLKRKSIQQTVPLSFPVVAIGASAGGLEALEQFFTHMPNESGMAFVVIQHLDPTHPGMLPELLQRVTGMDVRMASDRRSVTPNTVFVIPPNRSMSILNGSLHLFEPVETRGLRLPIDLFFRSMAEDRRENCVGIILSGMGSDGSIGLKAIKEHHGFVLVQDPETAKFDGMPRSALKSVIADVTAAAELLPSKLIKLLMHGHPVLDVQAFGGENDGFIEKIIIILRDRTGHDFSRYKKHTLYRRIERRKNIHQLESLRQYVRFLQENPKETDILFKELLIGVTNFFRDPPVWEMLKENVLIEMFAGCSNGQIIRAWVPGCSTGEEAYSLAIVMKEAAECVNKNITIQIFATDLDSDSIELARKGNYQKNISADVSPERLKRFFTEENDLYHVRSEIREAVIFASHNVIKDPPFTRLDVLTCRNMLIYFETELQKKLMTLFHFTLKPGGVLLLGSSETLSERKDGFQEIDTKRKIYKRTNLVLPFDLIDIPNNSHKTQFPASNMKPTVQPSENIQSVVDQILLQRFMPASVLVNGTGDILYITGDTGKYLAPVAGKANWNIYVMARQGLRQALPALFRKAQHSYDPVMIRSLRVGTDSGKMIVDITVQRIEQPETVRDHIMVIFSEGATVAPGVKKHSGVVATASSGKQSDLLKELEFSHDELQRLREEMQTSQEELKSTNEELQSTNEELQSTNEELTTSKEEMQSMNEELQSMNVELQTKVADYIQANNDMKNLLNSTEIATLFLEKNLTIRRFTDSVTNLFKLRTTDIGRPFTDLVSELHYPEIHAHAEQVMKTLITMETSVTTTDKRWFTVRIMPYRTLDDRIDGLVITFLNITIAKNLEIELMKANEALRKKNG